MTHYYYADAFEEEDGSILPAAVDDQGALVAADIPPGCQALYFDRDRDPRRFVLSLDPRWPTPPPGWVPVTEAQIEADYPGLLGGV